MAANSTKKFPQAIVEAIHDAKILGIRAGTKPHRIIGIWAVVVEGRVFVRSYSLKPREGDWPIIGFSPRKQNLTLYVAAGSQDPVLMKKLGKHTVSKGCLYIKRLSDVDLPTLKKVIQAAAKGK